MKWSALPRGFPPDVLMSLRDTLRGASPAERGQFLAMIRFQLRTFTLAHVERERGPTKYVEESEERATGR